MRELSAYALLALVLPVAAFRPYVPLLRVTKTIRRANSGVSEFEQDDKWLEACKSPGLTGLTALYDSTFAPGGEPEKKKAVAEQPETKASDNCSLQLETATRHPSSSLIVDC